uniref:Paf1 complex subunit Cdc73 N-terminal domain-containing protein n=2 Tax=Rhodosorus marinus TaxID=101924 RepID=A0A7S0BIV2_9RHOD|mmetsp:Transcript_18223/g.26420  ORF Transcript_18223/g.26420 Transcript_18223/m.26420 type:complete len:439 (+) Transcript_18223:522-1838(+)
MEAVQLLREASIKKDPVVLEGDELVFSNGKRLARTARTGLTSKGRGREQYGLDSLWFLLMNKDLPMRAYYEECKKEGIERVQIIDKRDVLDYLLGKVSEIAQIGGSKTVQKEDGAVETAKGAATATAEDIERDLKEIMSRERVLRTRDSMLVIEARSFKHVLEPLANCVKKMEDDRRAAFEEREAVAKTIDPRGDRYRVDNARFYREEMGTDLNELGIDPSGTFKKMGHKAPNPAPTAANRGRESGTSSGSIRPPSSSTGQDDSAKKPRVSTNRTPIIIVPGARDMSSLVNLANFPLLLRDKTFRPAMDIVKEGRAPTGSQVKHQRKSRGTGETVDYLLVANIRQLSASDWSRVVAVVCSGAEWQFKSNTIDRVPRESSVILHGPAFVFGSVVGIHWSAGTLSRDLKPLLEWEDHGDALFLVLFLGLVHFVEISTFAL